MTYLAHNTLFLLLLLFFLLPFSLLLFSLFLAPGSSQRDAFYSGDFEGFGCHVESAFSGLFCCVFGFRGGGVGVDVGVDVRGGYVVLLSRAHFCWLFGEG